MTGNRFRNRTQAGEFLAAELLKAGYGRDDRQHVLVLALPRGGVPVGSAVAKALHAPLDLLVVRKLGAPGQPEWAIGAIASGGARVLNPRAVRALGLTESEIDAITTREAVELQRRELAYRTGQSAKRIVGKTVLLVDDGLATGTTMRAAVCAVRAGLPARLVVAVPVAAAETCRELQREADAVICCRTPHPFFSVGEWYDDFSQTTDEEVRELWQRAAAGRETDE